MKESLALTTDIINNWASDARGPVALHLKRKLLPVEVDSKIIYPPTYANIGYNIDTLSDGTRVTTIDSVGSQANRMEPIFKIQPYSSLVPQIQIEIQANKKGEQGHIEKRSIFDLAHRSADAVVHASPKLSTIITKAFRALRENGDARPLCTVAPTSLVFGFWDSRGESQEKRPRLVRSIIRAWDVEPIHAAAQFNSIWKLLDDNQKAELESKAKKKDALSKKGFKDAPAIFRKTKIPQFRDDGTPNPESRVLGGVQVNGSIEQDVTVNLIALRALGGKDDQTTQSIQRYLLALTLLAASAEIELFLREGCHLRFVDDDRWNIIPRRGNPTPVDLASESTRKILLEYAKEAVKPFRDDWPKLVYQFDISAAKKLLTKKIEDEESED